jgi:hypothetical protein
VSKIETKRAGILCIILSLVGLFSYPVLCQENNSEQDFQITDLQLKIEFDEEGVATVTHIVKIELVTTNAITYNVWNVPSPKDLEVTFEEEEKEWDMEEGDEEEESERIHYPITIEMNSEATSGILKIVYKAIPRSPKYPGKDFEKAVISVSKIHVQNFEKFDDQLQEIRIDISVPENFPRWGNRIPCNLRFLDENKELEIIPYNHLDLQKEKIDTSKIYSAKLDIPDKEEREKNNLEFLDLEIIPFVNLEKFEKMDNPTEPSHTTLFYDVICREKDFKYYNPYNFGFELIVPHDAIILNMKSGSKIIGVNFRYDLDGKGDEYKEDEYTYWSMSTLPIREDESQEFSIVYIPSGKFMAVLVFLALGVLLFVYLLIKDYGFNNRFLGFLAGWSVWNVIIWLSVWTHPIFFEIITLSQIPLIFLYSYFFGHRSPMQFRIAIAVIIILTWFLPGLLVTVPEAIARLEPLLSFQSIGSSIFVVGITYLAGKYGRQMISHVLEAVRENMADMGKLAAFVIFVYVPCHMVAEGIEPWSVFWLRIGITIFFFVLLIILSSIWGSSYDCNGILKIESTFIRERTCYCKGKIFDISCSSEELDSDRQDEGKSIWVKFSNMRGYPIYGLDYSQVSSCSEVRFFGKLLSKEEIPESDKETIQRLEKKELIWLEKKRLIDAVYICKTYENFSRWQKFLSRIPKY